MTTTPPPDQPAGQPNGQPGSAPGAPAGSTQVDDGPRVTRDEVRDLARLRRTTGTQRNVAGVAGGLGRHLDIDPVILRVAFVVLTFFGGAGILLYGAAWLLVPDDESTSPPLGLDERSRAVALWIAAGIGATILLGASFGDGFVPVPVILVAGLALLVVLQLNKKKNPGAPPAAYAVALDKAPAGMAPSSTTAQTPAHATLPVAGWVQPSPVWTPPTPRVNPRKRGPVLFWFTLALAALAVGVLGVVDAAGAPVAGAAYPALVLGVVGAMLVLGAWWGRAGGLVLLGLLTLPWLAGAVAVGSFDGDTVRYAPTTAAEVQASYRFADGELLLDLSGVQDPAALAGRTITIDGDVGHVEVLVPEGLAVEADAQVDGPGGFDLFGNQGGGIGTTGSGSVFSDVDPLVIDTRLEIGVVDVQTNGSTR